MNFQENFIRQTIVRLKATKKGAEAAILQVPVDKLFIAPASGSNSLAVIIQHIAGNMISRWTDFLHSDGEKSWRHRDQEFEPQTDDPQVLMAKWAEGWACFLDTLANLTSADLDRKVTIRGESHFVYDAILRQVMHYSQHCGQIIYLAKWLVGEDWQSLSIPKGGSDAYNHHLNRPKGSNPST